MRYFILFILFQYNLSYGQRINLIEQQASNRVVLELIEEGILLDSLVIDNVDFSYTYLQEINNQYSHFVYGKLKPQKQEINRDQILIYKGDNKLSIAFVSREESSRTPSSKAEIGGGDIYYSYKHLLNFDELDNNLLKMDVTSEIVYEEDSAIRKEKNVNKYEFNLFEEEMFFYNGYDTLDGSYDYCVVEDNLVKGFIPIKCHRVFLAIKFDSYSYLYLNKNWYYFSKDSRILKSYIREIIPPDMNKMNDYPKSQFEEYELIEEW